MLNLITKIKIPISCCFKKKKKKKKQQLMYPIENEKYSFLLLYCKKEYKHILEFIIGTKLEYPSCVKWLFYPWSWFCSNI